MVKRNGQHLVNVRIDELLWRRFKAQAALDGKDLRELVTCLIQEYLTRKAQETGE